MAVDKRTGNAYYYNDRGDTTYERPRGFVQAQNTNQPRGAFSMFTMRRNNSIRLKPVQGSGQPAQAMSREVNRTVNTQRSGRSGRSGRSNGSGGSGRSGRTGATRPTPSVGNPPGNLRVNEKVATPLKALYDYVARYDDELSIRKGQLVMGMKKVDGGKWWFGEAQGKRGHFPANFVTVVENTTNRAPVPAGATYLGNSGNNSNYGASSPNWYNGQPQQAPAVPPKPDAIAFNQTPRSPAAQIKDEAAIKATPGSKNTLKYTYLGHTWGYAFAIHAIALGGFSILWFLEAEAAGQDSEKARLLGTQFNFTGPLVIGVGLLALVLEYTIGLKKTDMQYKMVGGLPFRTIFYFLASGPCFTSFATILAGIIGIFASAANYLSERNKERGTAKRQRFMFRCSPSIIYGWGCKTGLIMFTFVLFNIFLFAVRYVVVDLDFRQCLLDEAQGIFRAGGCGSEFAAGAKGGGTSLDFTCAVIVLPVARAFLKRISTIQVSGSKTLATVIPLKKNIQGHKMIAFAIAIGTLVHIVFHFINFALEPEDAIATFGGFALYTGGILTLLMVIIFNAAHESVRRSSFEAFWYSHQAFLFVFPFTLAHGPKYWYFALIPIPLYAFDRLVRARRGSKPMLVDYVRFSSPVLKLHFFPQKIEDFVFREGQYLWIQCPYINDYEWHPFTISSSFGDLEKYGYVSLHIRVQAEGSWTWQLKEYFRLLSGSGSAQMVSGPDGKKKEAPFETYLTSFDKAGVIQRGKHFGPDGKPLVRIDGPHAAPAQTYSTYRDVMLVGSGIGLTPSAAILSAVTRHKWKKGFQPETLRFFWVVRHSEIDSFEWFIELLDDVSRKVVADRKAGSISSFHRLEINIYVTSAPSSTELVRQFDPAVAAAKNLVKEKREKESNIKEAGLLSTYLGFDMSTIKSLLKNPTVSSKEQAKIQYSNWGATNRLPNRLGYIYCYNGRPQWNDIFSAVRDGRQNGIQEIGVCYCGAPNIGEDLKTNCKKFTGPGCKFTLNKEVF